MRDEEVLNSWEEPSTQELAKNAVPLEQRFADLSLENNAQPPSAGAPGEPEPNTQPPNAGAPGEPEPNTQPPSAGAPGEPEPNTQPPSAGAPGEPEPNTQPPNASAPGEPVPEPIPAWQRGNYPYHSVGELFWFQPKRKFYEDAQRIYSATAFYIGNSKIISAAHNFDDTIDRAGIFLPAMQDRGDFRGKLFGRYVIEVDPQSRHTCLAYDICTYHVRIGRQGLSQLFKRRSVNIDEVYADLKKIELDPEEPDVDTNWTVLGYPNESGVLSKVTGHHLPNKSRKGFIVMDKKCPKGMSGGPWIKGWPAFANGCQSSNLIHGACSPRFNPQLFRDLRVTGVIRKRL